MTEQEKPGTGEKHRQVGTISVDQAKRHRLVLSWTSIIASLGALANIVLAVLTYSLLKEGVAARGVSERALVEANRAWVAPAGVYFTSPVQAGVNAEYLLEFKNTGRQPALNVYVDHTTQVVARDPTGSWVGTGKDSTRCDTKLANGTLYPTDKTMGQMLTLPKEYITEAFLQGNTAIVFQGCFRYKTFDEIHRTGFCLYIVARPEREPQNWGWNICTNGNFAD